MLNSPIDAPDNLQKQNEKLANASLKKKQLTEI
jgi:hypothetical protein